jgi:hypothetical protein
MKDCTILNTYRQATSTFLSLVLFFLSWAIPQATAKTINQVPFVVGSVTADKFTRSYTTSTFQRALFGAGGGGVTLAEANIVDGRVRLRWIIPPASGAMFGKIQRRTDATEWSDLAGPYALNEPDFSYEDASPPADMRVGYRLQLWDSEDQWYSGEAWLDVPAEAGALALPGFP